MKFLFILLPAFTCSLFFAQQRITPEDAAKHVGDSVSVGGKVYGGVYLEHSKRQPTLINLGAVYPISPFTAVIFQQVRY